MKVETDDFQAANNGEVIHPRYVVALSFDDADTDITYLTSHSDALDPGGVAAIDRIDGAIVSISGQSQKISPDKSQHTIGNVSFQLLDVGGALSAKIKTKLDGGEGLRGKRVVLYKGAESLTAWSDYSRRLTYLVENVSYNNGTYALDCADIQRSAKTKIMEVHQGVLTSDITASETLPQTIPVTIADASSKFPTVYHNANHESHPSQSVGYIEIDDEIIAHSGWSDGTYTALQVVERGAFGTVAEAHENPTGTTSSDQNKKVEEYVVLYMPAPALVYSIETGLIPQAADLSSGRTLADMPAIENKVVNGNQESGDNTGFSPLTYQATGGIDGGPCFSHAGVSLGTVTMDNFIAVDPSKKHLIRGAIKADSTPGLTRYMGFACYDSDLNYINPWECWRDVNKNTTLYEAVSPTDTTVKIVPASEAWFTVSSPFSYIQWDIKSDGSDFPQNNAIKITNIDTSTAGSGYWLLTLAGQAGVTYSSGTAVGNSYSGGTYSYAIHSGALPNTDWKQTTALITGLNDIDAFPAATEFRRGTAYIKILCYGEVGDVTYFDNIEFFRFFYDSMPSHWHLGIDTAYVQLSDFTGIGSDLWDTSADSGRYVRFHGEKDITAKSFIEQQILSWLACYMPVYSDGALGLRRFGSVLPYSSYIASLDESQITRHGALNYDQKAVINNLSIKWNYIQTLDRYTKTTQLIDSNSVDKYGEAEQKTFEYRGIFTGLHTDQDINNYFDQIRDRYAAPPLRLSIGCLPEWDKLDVGDSVRVTLPQLWDYNAGDTLDRVFEVQQVRTDWITGAVSLELFGGVEQATHAALSSSFVMADSYYTGSGTNLASVLTISGGTVTANGSLAGGATLGAGVYYYDGDLTIADGVTVTVSSNVLLKIKGQLTVNGAIDGIGNGEAGGVAPALDNTEYTSFPALSTYRPVVPSANSGGIGWSGSQYWRYTNRGGSYRYRVTWPNGLYTYLTTGGIKSVSDLTFYNDGGTSIDGLNTLNLTGIGGISGAAFPVWDDKNFVTDRYWLAGKGGDGGAGGAGLAIVCRGLTFGLGDSIDLSGGDGTAGTSRSLTMSSGTTTYHANSGIGGSPGGCVVLIDGNASPPSTSNFTLDRGATPSAGASYTLPAATSASVDLDSNPSSIAYPAWSEGAAWGAGFYKGEHLLIKYIDVSEAGYIQYQADEAKEVTGYENKPPTWTEVKDDGGKPANNATVGADYEVNVANKPYEADNLVTKSAFEDGLVGSWDAASGTVATIAGQDFSKAYQFEEHISQLTPTQFVVTAGELLYVSAFANAASANYDVIAGIEFKDSAGATVSTSDVLTFAQGASWAEKNGTVTVPATAKTAVPTFKINDTPPGAATGTAQVTEFRVRRAESGATVGSKAGTNLRDAAGNLLGDAQVLNSYNVLDSAITVTVGTGGDYSTINAALVGLTQQFPTYASTAARATINLLTGFQIDEQIFIDGIDLSWITITSVDAVVDVVMVEADYTNTVSFLGLTLRAIVGAVNGGRSPIIDLSLDASTNTVSTLIGLLAFGNGSVIDVGTGSTVTGTGGTSSTAAFMAAAGGRVGTDDTLTADDFRYGFYAWYSGVIYGKSLNVTNSTTAAINASQGGIINSFTGSLHVTGGSAGVTANNGGVLNLSQQTITGTYVDAVAALTGSKISIPSSTITVGSNTGYKVEGGSIISANLSSNISSNITKNTINSKGIIFHN